jgi:hypothetical protein
MAKSVKDADFGPIEWTGSRWTALLSAPYFKGSGARKELTDADRAHLPPSGQFPLQIDTNKVRKPPDAAQRAAWRTITGRGDAIWEEALEAMVAEYRRQRALRERYWHVVNNPVMLAKSMPAEVDAATMRELILPHSLTIQEADTARGDADCYLTALATWSEPVNAYIRDGQVTEITPMGFFMNRQLPWIDTQAFGKLRRVPRNATPWYGEIQLAPFKSFAAIAVNRATWDRSYKRRGEATSDLPWDVARGFTNLFVFAPEDQQPSSEQVRVFTEFVGNIDDNAAVILDALIEFYRRVAPERRREFKHIDPQVAIPNLKSAKDLADITELSRVNLFPEIAPTPIAMGFVFRGSWTDTNGIGLRWRDGKVEEVGAPSVAHPESPKSL